MPDRCAAEAGAPRSPYTTPAVPFRAAGLLMLIAAPAWTQPQQPPDPRPAVVLFLLLLPVALCSFTALELVLWVLAPAPLSATCQAIARGRGRCLLTGSAAAVASLVLISNLGKVPGPGQRLAALSLGLLAVGVVIGITAVSALLGQGVVDLAGRTGSRALAVVVGSLLLGFMILFPIIGQVFGLYFVLVGLGGALQALARSGRRKE